MEKITTKNMK